MNKFKQSKYTLITGLADIPVIWVGVYMIVASNWIPAIICLIGSFGLGVFHTTSLAADYAKWREGRELHEFKGGSENEDH